jgi:hypothetical protein
MYQTKYRIPSSTWGRARRQRKQQPDGHTHILSNHTPSGLYNPVSPHSDSRKNKSICPTIDISIYNMRYLLSSPQLNAFIIYNMSRQPMACAHKHALPHISVSEHRLRSMRQSMVYISRSISHWLKLLLYRPSSSVDGSIFVVCPIGTTRCQANIGTTGMWETHQDINDSNAEVS